MKTLSDQEKKKQQELEEWLEQVHFASCCSDIGVNERGVFEKHKSSTNLPTEVSKK